MRKHKWLELQKDYDITILYHLGKANVMVDALNMKNSSMRSLVAINVQKRPLARVVQRLANSFVQNNFLKRVVD